MQLRLERYHPQSEHADEGNDKSVQNSLDGYRGEGGGAAEIIVDTGGGTVSPEYFTKPGRQNVVSHETDQDQLERVPEFQSRFPDHPASAAQEVSGDQKSERQQQFVYAGGTYGRQRSLQIEVV